MTFDYFNYLQTRSTELQGMTERAQRRISKAPEGSLEICIRKKKNVSVREKNDVSYYKREHTSKEKKRRRVYLRTDELDIAKALAQKEYDKRLLMIAQKQKKTIDAFLRDYDANALKDLFTKLSPERRALIQVEEIDDEEYARQWEAVTFSTGDFEAGDPEFYTHKGERVRSKAEIIIADTLHAQTVPYRYEPPLMIIPGKKVWRPDFVVLNKRTRQEFILEHLGKMDDEKYCNDNLGKIKTYMEHGIFPGEKLILTAETSTRPLSTRDLEKIIQHFFL